MTAPIARALMMLAARCLGDDRRDWALAMQSEYEAAASEGHALSFAAGCLLASLREMPRHGEGRLSLARHAAVLFLLLPLASLQIGWAIDVGSHLGVRAEFWLTGGSRNPYILNAQLSALPAILILWVLLTIGHLNFAWLALERDLERLVQAGALVLATAITLLLFLAAIFANPAILLPHAAALVAELILVAMAAPSGERPFIRQA